MFKYAQNEGGGFFLFLGYLWRVLNWCYFIVLFQDMIIFGLQFEIFYFFIVIVYIIKGDGVRSKFKLVFIIGVGNFVCVCMCFECVLGNNNINFLNGIGGFY